MLYPSMSELLGKVDNRYSLVNIAAKRARDIAEYADEKGIPLNEKPVTMALDDIVNGRIVPAQSQPETENPEDFSEE